MIKPIFLCLCVCLQVACKASADSLPLYPAQTNKPDAAAKEFSRHVHYPYIAPEARRRRIERAAKEGRLGQTEAQVLAQLGPPDWKEDKDGHPPEIPPFQVWYYVHTWKHQVGPDYHGKMVLIYIRKVAPQTSDEVEAYGL